MLRLDHRNGQVRRAGVTRRHTYREPKGRPCSDATMSHSTTVRSCPWAVIRQYCGLLLVGRRPATRLVAKTPLSLRSPPRRLLSFSFDSTWWARGPLKVLDFVRHRA